MLPKETCTVHNSSNRGQSNNNEDDIVDIYRNIFVEVLCKLPFESQNQILNYIISQETITEVTIKVLIEYACLIFPIEQDQTTIALRILIQMLNNPELTDLVINCFDNQKPIKNRAIIARQALYEVWIQFIHNQTKQLAAFMMVLIKLNKEDIAEDLIDQMVTILSTAPKEIPIFTILSKMIHILYL